MNPRLLGQAAIIKSTTAIFLLLFSMPSLSGAITYTCKYSTYSKPDGLSKVKDNFEMTFIVDDITSKAYLHGNNGIAEVEYFAFSDRTAFLEVTPGGNLMTTTIDGQFNSVHSRNSVIGGELSPSQYYGKCKVGSD